MPAPLEQLFDEGGRDGGLRVDAPRVSAAATGAAADGSEPVVFACAAHAFQWQDDAFVPMADTAVGLAIVRSAQAAHVLVAYDRNKSAMCSLPLDGALQLATGANLLARFGDVWCFRVLAQHKFERLVSVALLLQAQHKRLVNQRSPAVVRTVWHDRSLGQQVVCRPGDRLALEWQQCALPAAGIEMKFGSAMLLEVPDLGEAMPEPAACLLGVSDLLVDCVAGDELVIATIDRGSLGWVLVRAKVKTVERRAPTRVDAVGDKLDRLLELLEGNHESEGALASVARLAARAEKLEQENAALREQHPQRKEQWQQQASRFSIEEVAQAMQDAADALDYRELGLDPELAAGLLRAGFKRTLKTLRRRRHHHPQRTDQSD